MYPGRMPKWCFDCYREVRREQARLRKRRQRARQKAKQAKPRSDLLDTDA